jgi:hypothetical protein
MYILSFRCNWDKKAQIHDFAENIGEKMAISAKIRDNYGKMFSKEKLHFSEKLVKIDENTDHNIDLWSELSKI